MSTTIQDHRYYGVAIAVRRCMRCPDARPVQRCVSFATYDHSGIDLCTAKCWPQLVRDVDRTIDGQDREEP